MSKLVHVWVGTELKRSINELVKEGWFSNQAELIRESIRNTVTEYYRRKALANLPKQRGILKGKGRGLTQADRNRIAMEMTPERSKELFRQLGFDKV